MRVALFVLLFTASCAPEPARQSSDQVDEVGQHRIERASPDGAAAAAWNSLAYDIAFAEDQFLTFKGQRAFSMMHLAMHDALNTIVPRYHRYAYAGPKVEADPTAAAAQAAYQVLLSQYPAKKARLDAELADWLDPIAGSAKKARAIELGKATAVAILSLRAGDRWDFQGSYHFRRGSGEYQTTPPWDGFVAQPGFGRAKPFTLASPRQFRPPPPPPLTSSRYASAFNEVKDYGAAGSKVRTRDQTGYAVWWMEFAEGSVNRLARQLVKEKKADLWEATRLFAQLNIALYDGYIAEWDSKYEFNHWRPYTATREAGRDGNAGTTPDRDWKPLRDTPPFPEYLSAHAAACAGSFEVLRRMWGNEVAFTMSTITAPPGMPTRSFASFTAAAAECADSRVRLGWHFRYSTDAGLRLGRQVAEHVVDDYLKPR